MPRTLLLLPFAVLILGCLGCQESKEVSQISPELAATIDRIQGEHDLSDEDLSKALERWVEMYEGAKELLESEDIFGSGAWSPERYAELLHSTEKAFNEVRIEDEGMAAWNLVHLNHLNEERYDDLGKSLREKLARHYGMVKDRPDGEGDVFVKSVRELAESDPELKRLLEQTGSSGK